MITLHPQSLSPKKLNPLLPQPQPLPQPPQHNKINNRNKQLFPPLFSQPQFPQFVAAKSLMLSYLQEFFYLQCILCDGGIMCASFCEIFFFCLERKRFCTFLKSSSDIIAG